MARIGTSGWSYDHWEDVLYEPGLDDRKRLVAYAKRFSTAEFMSSRERWPRTGSLAALVKRLPDGFVLSMQAPRGLVRGRKLFAPEAWSERIAAGFTELGVHAGVLIIQVDADLPRDDARLAYLLSVLPRGVRVSLEFLHPSWHVEEVFGILEEHGAGYCVLSGAQLPCVLRATATTVVAHLHGPDHEVLHAGSYSHDDLDWWAARIREWEATGHEVLVTFTNTDHANAVRNALDLEARLA